jgi:hypothetical protein
MRLEAILLIAVTLISIISLLFIPKKKRFQAQLIFLFVQFPTWILGLSAVELRLLEYPYRELSKVNRTSFIFEYLVLPVLCIHFNAHFPQNVTRKKKLVFYLGTTSILTGVEVVLEKFTDVIKYTGWKWYMTFLSVWFVLWLSRIVTSWYFKNNKLVQ